MALRPTNPFCTSFDKWARWSPDGRWIAYAGRVGEDGLWTYASDLVAATFACADNGADIINMSWHVLPYSQFLQDVMDYGRARGSLLVAAAGNEGGQAETITVPGNDPYVITVGSMTDNFTPYDEGDDSISTFSACGPTVEGFVKPDLVAGMARGHRPAARLADVADIKPRPSQVAGRFGQVDQVVDRALRQR